MNMEREKERLVRFIRGFTEEYGFEGAVVGVSGGVDSAVVAGLSSLALPGKVRALILPERDSPPETVKDAKLVCEHFKIPYKVVSITPILRKMGVYKLQSFLGWFVPYSVKKKYALSKWKEFGGEDVYNLDLSMKGSKELLKGVAYYRVKHRVRMCMLYLEAERLNYTVVGTTNKTEYLLGFYVKWGDDSVDLEPLIHLYKTQVFDLARVLNVPERIIQKPPSPDLIPGITDEFAIGMSYEEIDELLLKFEKRELSDDESPKVRRLKRILEDAKRRALKTVNVESWERGAHGEERKGESS